MSMELDQITIGALGEASACPACASNRFIKHGMDRDGQQRWKCSNCGRTSLHFHADKFRQAGLRSDPSKIINLLMGVGKGLSIRAAASLAGVSKGTGMSIIRVFGFVRRCRKCGQPIAGQRFMFCSDECQEWRSRTYRSIRTPQTGSPEFYDGTANVLRYIEDNGCSPHVRLAMQIASEVSAKNMDLYLGPVYEGIEMGHAAGITDERVLRRFGRDAVKRHWKEIQTFGARSLDAMREAHGFEPTDELSLS